MRPVAYKVGPVSPKTANESGILLESSMACSKMEGGDEK